MGKRILVTVSRTYDNPAEMERVLRAAWTWAPGAVLVHGAQKDSDLRAVRIWASLGGQDEPHPVRWRPEWNEGKVWKFAGFDRSEKMAKLGADLCLAFFGPCDREDCSLRGKHASHGASHCSGYADRVCGIMTRRFGSPIPRA